VICLPVSPQSCVRGRLADWACFVSRNKECNSASGATRHSGVGRPAPSDPRRGPHPCDGSTVSSWTGWRPSLNLSENGHPPSADRIAAHRAARRLMSSSMSKHCRAFSPKLQDARIAPLLSYPDECIRPLRARSDDRSFERLGIAARRPLVASRIDPSSTTGKAVGERDSIRAARENSVARAARTGHGLLASLQRDNGKSKASAVLAGIHALTEEAPTARSVRAAIAAARGHGVQV
jgi:hypothetical protein